MLHLLHRLKSDESLMLAYGRGNSQAFDVLYRRHKDALFSFLFHSYPQRAVVEDLAQETWMAVIRAAERYQADASFRTWLYQIAHNRLVDFWRRKDNNHSQLESQTVETLTNDDEPYPQLQQQLMLAITKLPRDQRDTLLLREQGFSYTDIAEITGTGTETVKSRLRYARSELRELLGDEL